MILRRICRLMLTRITQQVSRVFEFTQKEWYKVMKEEKLCDRSGAYIAPNATVIGAVSMGKDSRFSGCDRRSCHGRSCSDHSRM